MRAELRAHGSERVDDAGAERDVRDGHPLGSRAILLVGVGVTADGDAGVGASVGASRAHRDPQRFARRPRQKHVVDSSATSWSSVCNQNTGTQRDPVSLSRARAQATAVAAL